MIQSLILFSSTKGSCDSLWLISPHLDIPVLCTHCKDGAFDPVAMYSDISTGPEESPPIEQAVHLVSAPSYGWFLFIRS